MPASSCPAGPGRWDHPIVGGAASRPRLCGWFLRLAGRMGSAVHTQGTGLVRSITGLPSGGGSPGPSAAAASAQGQSIPAPTYGLLSSAALPAQLPSPLPPRARPPWCPVTAGGAGGHPTPPNPLPPSCLLDCVSGSHGQGLPPAVGSGHPSGTQLLEGKPHQLPLGYTSGPQNSAWCSVRGLGPTGGQRRDLSGGNAASLSPASVHGLFAPFSRRQDLREEGQPPRVTRLCGGRERSCGGKAVAERQGRKRRS